MPSVPLRTPSAPPSPRKPARPTHGTCRLTLRINGTSYTVLPIPSDAFAALKAFRLKKSDGAVYDASQTVYGLECDCPDFVFHRDGLDPDGCKHVKALVACGLFDRKGGSR
ncbi:MAG: hypothetical protein NVSMB9_09180 [Isosphaeraceae bacterium]